MGFRRVDHRVTRGRTAVRSRRHWARRASVVAVSVIATVGLLTASASATGSESKWQAQLNKQVPAALKKAQLPGAIVGVWQGNKRVYLKAFGVADTKTQAPLKTDSHVRIGSLTKPYTVMGILQLVEDGKLALDDPVGKYIQGVPNGDVITLRQLAEMRSGLGDYSEAVTSNLYKDPKKQWTTQEVLDIGLAEPVRFEPGAQFDYNNTNTTLLGAILEKVSGMSRREYVKERITEPLGLENTSVPSSNAIPDPHSRGYGDWNPEQRVEDVTNWSPSWGQGAGDMISNVEDIAAWTRALGTGKLITPALQQEREKGLPSPTEGVGTLYGLAYEIHPGGWQGHNGRIPGWTTFPYYLPDEKMTIVVSINTSANVIGSWPFFQSVVGTVTPNHPFSDPPTE
jgi:D-alanyl-D-alanine carboxypeptidase